MAFDSNKDVLDWYEGQERALTPEFISSIPWDKVRDTPFDERFVPVLFYMRDVETLTDMYHRELQRTPTGKDPHISKFMERWGVEEITHGEMMDAVLKPFVSEEIRWVVSHHGVFQEYYYGHLTGGDRNARERYRGHPWFDACADFCERYDQNCFDPDYESLPLERFEPLVREVFSEPRYLGR